MQGVQRKANKTRCRRIITFFDNTRVIDPVRDWDRHLHGAIVSTTRGVKTPAMPHKIDQ